jgi:hypothetical protein
MRIGCLRRRWITTRDALWQTRRFWHHSGRLALPARSSQPFPDGEGAPEYAQCDKDHHTPFERLRFCDREHALPKLKGQKSQDQETNAAGEEIDHHDSPDGIVDGADCCDHTGKGEGRWRQAGKSHRNPGAITDAPPQPVVPFVSRHFANALFAQFARDNGEEECPDAGANCSREDIQGNSTPGLCHKRHYEQIVAEGQDEERRIQNAHKKRAEVTGVEQGAEERGEEIHSDS